MTGSLLSYQHNPSIAANHFISSQTEYCYTANCLVSVEDKFIDLERIHDTLRCSVVKNYRKKDNSINYKEKMSERSSYDDGFRPRGALARTLYKKYQNDCKLSEINKFEWYQCDSSSMSLKAYSHFLQLSPDAETREFISNSIEKSTWVWTQIWHCLAKSFLSFFMTRTDINGWLGRGSMFVLSMDQIAQILNSSGFYTDRDSREECTILDLGAGDGEVTVIWKELFTKLYATEMSGTMRSLLESKGFEVLDTERWWVGNTFDVVCMLNLLDRCSEPFDMLMNARKAVKDNGLIIIALVLPFKAYVEYTTDHKPHEHLPISGKTFEKQVNSFIDFAETNVGLSLVHWTKVPYLCEGDIDQSYYWLNDAIFIFRKNLGITASTSGIRLD